MKTVSIEKQDGSMEEMGVEEFTRWMCLVEAFHFIEEKANELNVDWLDLVKPLAVESYIKSRYVGMLHDVSCEVELGQL